MRPRRPRHWTRGHRTPDVTPTIRRYLPDQAFAGLAFVAPADALFSVGIHRFTGTPRPLQPDRRLFTFVKRE